jgi:hypothetical protein
MKVKTTLKVDLSCKMRISVSQNYLLVQLVPISGAPGDRTRVTKYQPAEQELTLRHCLPVLTPFKLNFPP